MTQIVTRKWRDAVVAVDEGPRYPCQLLDPPQFWNGWDCPRFTRDVAERIAEWVTENGWSSPGFIPYADRWPDSSPSWDWQGDSLVIRDGSEDEPEVYEPDADGLYHVGSWYWCWSEVVS